MPSVFIVNSATLHKSLLFFVLFLSSVSVLQRGRLRLCIYVMI